MRISFYMCWKKHEFLKYRFEPCSLFISMKFHLMYISMFYVFIASGGYRTVSGVLSSQTEIFSKWIPRSTMIDVWCMDVCPYRDQCRWKYGWSIEISSRDDLLRNSETFCNAFYLGFCVLILHHCFWPFAIPNSKTPINWSHEFYQTLSVLLNVPRI